MKLVSIVSTRESILHIKLYTCWKVEMDGLTGRIKFDQFGLRTDFMLEIVELKKTGLQKVT